MRRAVVLSVTFLLVGCHKSQAAPNGGASTDSTTAAETHGATAPLRSAATDAGSQIRPSLAIADGTLALGWMVTSPDKPTLLGARLSHDLGATWSPVETIASPDGRSAAEPALGVSDRGAVYVAWLGSRPDSANGDAHVYVSLAERGATAFGTPVEVTDRMQRDAVVDQPQLAMTADGTALVSWRYVGKNGNGIGIARGDAKGTWTPGKVIERVGLQAWLPSLCVSAHGDRVWVAYVDGEVGVRVRASDDGAASWSPARAATVSLAEEKPRLAMETPVCAGDGNDVAVAYGRTREARSDDRSPGLDAIVVARSFDGGRTYDWRRTIEMGDQVALQPRIVREPDGALDVAYYALPAADVAGEAAQLRFVRFADRTAAATPPRVAKEHLKIARERKSPAWPGESFGFAWHDGKVYFAAVDAEGGVPRVAFASAPAK